MKAIVFKRKEARYAAGKLAAKVSSDAALKVGPLSLTHLEPLALPDASSWHRLRPRLSGICGSDLSTIACETSLYFEPLVSFPFVLGHEIVGDLEDGTRVVIDAVLGHAARGHTPPHPEAAPGDGNDYGHSIAGHLKAGIQTGNCASTGGGWSTELVVHDSQIHPVPESFSDEAAVLVEPCASGYHTALKAVVGGGAARTAWGSATAGGAKAAGEGRAAGESNATGGPKATKGADLPEGMLQVASVNLAVVIGAGTIGLCALAALRKIAPGATIIAAAKHPEQRSLAEELGADVVAKPSELRRAVRRACGCRMTGDLLSGGADVTIDAVGSAASLADAIAVTRPRGRITLSGMPGSVQVDLAPVWHRETEIVGSYTYGTEHLPDGTETHTFPLAMQLIEELELERLVSAHYRLDDYRRAIRHAMSAGELGATKIVFDLRDE